jgi:hypothetical protein
MYGKRCSEDKKSIGIVILYVKEQHYGCIKEIFKVEYLIPLPNAYEIRTLSQI